MPIIIGVLGEKRSGKGAFAKLLRDIVKPITVARIGASEILSKTLEIWEIEKSRKNFQKLAVVMDKGFGKGTVTNAVWQRILADPSEIVIFDGVRWQSDLEKIRTFERNYIVYVTAGTEIRWRRSLELTEKTGENTATFEEFMNEEKMETEKYIPELGAKADFKIVNEGTLDDFRNEVRKFVTLYFSRSR